MKFIAFIIALILFGLGVYFLILNNYTLAVVLMVTMIAFLNLIDHSPQP